MKKSLGADTLFYPAPVFLVGTYDSEHKPNIMTAAWGGICCSAPPAITVSLRKATYTYAAILANQGFTINIPTENYVREVDYVGIVSGRSESKFEVLGLTPVKATLVNAPYIHEFPLILECRLQTTVEVGLHTMFVGEVLDVKADSDILGNNGIIDMAKLRPIAFAPGSGEYFGIGDMLGKAFNVGKK